MWKRKEMAKRNIKQEDKTRQKKNKEKERKKKEEQRKRLDELAKPNTRKMKRIQMREHKAGKTSEADNTIQSFLQIIMKGPECICCVWYRLMCREYVVLYNENVFTMCDKELLETCNTQKKTIDLHHLHMEFEV
jgi:acetyl-CoA carboxylase carboxyltransferase component